MANYRSIAPDIERIRDRLRAMRTEREAVMDRLAKSREDAEAHRQVRAPADAAPPDTPAAYSP